MLLLTTGAARAQAGIAGGSPGSEASLSWSAQKRVDPPQSAPRWTFSVEMLALGRWGGANQTLVARVPGNVPFLTVPPAAGYDSATYPSVEALNSNQLREGFSAGPKLSLTYRDDSGYGVELSYFDVLGLSGAKAVGPDNPKDWLVMKAPGSFWQTQDFPYQAMAWGNSTSLYSAEVNGRLDLSPRVTLLGGLRWLQLNDELVGSLTPADRTAPDWKTYCYSYALDELSSCPHYPGGTAGSYPPFWQANTRDNLYGAQIGFDAKLLELGRFSLGGLIKAGVFDDNAEQTTVVSMTKTLFTAQATTNHVAFVGEAELQLKYQLTTGLTLKAGYEALWLDGFALAAGQIRETYTTPPPALSARALGVNSGSNVLFQGATVGLEFSF
jgi:hypothetical protein